MCDAENFDVDSLRHQHESPTEWRLRRKFLLAHKDSLPLPSLLCMASCFINIELSGCTYPPAVMERVRTLAEAIRDDVESHRKEVKARTEVKFVKAAADPSQPGTSKSGSGPNELIDMEEPGDAEVNVESSSQAVDSTQGKMEIDAEPTGPSVLQPSQGSSIRTTSLCSEAAAASITAAITPDFILFEDEDKTNYCRCAVGILRFSSYMCDVPVSYECSQSGGEVICVLQVGDVYTGTGKGRNQKFANADAAQKAVTELRQRHYTIQAKTYVPNIQHAVSISGKRSVDTSAIPESNTGNKLLKTMGRTGGGVGKEGQGIVEPASLDITKHKQGLGSDNATDLSHNLKQKLQQILIDYSQSDDDEDLVFTSDLTSDQRKMIYAMGAKLELRTTMYKKGKEQYMVVSPRKRDFQKLFHTLKECGGENEKFRLLYPGQHELTNSTSFPYNLQAVKPAKPASREGLAYEPDFVLHEHADIRSADFILQHSCAICNVPIVYDCETGPNEVSCTIRLGDIYSGKGQGRDEHEAKADASEKALDKLRESHYTIQAKTQQDQGIRLGVPGHKICVISDADMENLLLKMMSKIEGYHEIQGDQPVVLDRVISKDELGLCIREGMSPKFKKKIQGILSIYVRNRYQKDLIFPPDLTDQEWKIIHKIAAPLGLSTKRYDRSGWEHFLVLSGKVKGRKTFEMFHTLVKCGGENDKYRLIVPGQHESLIGPGQYESLIGHS